MRGVTIDVSVNLVTETCCVPTCGILFAVPEDWQRARRRDHTNFYCPNGHHQAYLSKTKEEQLRDQLTAANKSLEYHQQRGDRLEDANANLKNSNRALRGVATKLKRKAATGECGFCHAQFADVAAHVEAEHPAELAAANGDGDDQANAETPT
jgi:hypothetical protein